MMTPGLNDKLLWALTPQATEVIGILIKAGLDRDLALSFLEQFWEEADIYELPDDVGPSSV